MNLRFFGVLHLLSFLDFLSIIWFKVDAPRVPVLLSDEHSADEAVVLSVDTSLSKRTSGASTSNNGKTVRHRIRKESGML